MLECPTTEDGSRRTLGTRVPVEDYGGGLPQLFCQVVLRGPDPGPGNILTDRKREEEGPEQVRHKEKTKQTTCDQSVKIMVFPISLIWCESPRLNR